MFLQRRASGLKPLPRMLDLAIVASLTVTVPQSQDRSMTPFAFWRRALLALAVITFRLACEHASRAAH